MRNETRRLVQVLANEAGERRLCMTGRSLTERRLLERLVRAGDVVSPLRGMFALIDEWCALDPIERTRRMVRTLSAKHPDWVFCLFTAAIQHGLWVSYADALPICVAKAPGSYARPNATIRRVPTIASEVATADGVKAIALERTLSECLLLSDFKRVLPLADSALRLSGRTRRDLIDYARRSLPDEESGKVIDVLAWASPLSESGGESMARAVMVEQGFMMPKLQVEVPDPLNPPDTYRADFLWELADGTRVAGEFDGHEKYVNPKMTGGRDAIEVLADERQRESRLGARGLRVVRFSYRDVVNEGKLVRLLELYGIPRGPARPGGRVPRSSIA